jgi:hypothetical protein
VQLEIRGVERLSFRERQVVVLKETGQPNEAVARRLGVSPATVATLYARAKAKGYQVVVVVDGDPLGLFEPGAEADAGEPGGDAAGGLPAGGGVEA